MKNSRQLIRKLLIASLISIFVFVGTFPGKVNASPESLRLLRERVDLESLPTGRNTRLRRPQISPETSFGINTPPPPYDCQNLNEDGDGPLIYPNTLTVSTFTNSASELTSKNLGSTLTIGGVEFGEVDSQPLNGILQYESRKTILEHNLAPTLKITPGKTIDLKLTNELDPESVDQPYTNPTNYHYHGFHVSSQEGSDNVLMEIPGSNYQSWEDNPDYSPPDHVEDNIYTMEVNVPANHQPGLEWYHPHVHEYTNDEVRKGLASAIIIDGIQDYYPFLQTVFGIKDDDTSGEGTLNQVMLFNNLDTLIYFANGDDTSCNKFTINNQYKPSISIKPGEVQFWRMANTDAFTYLNLVLAKVDGDNYVPQPLYVLGLDGYPTQKPLEKKSILLPPGSRAEVLVGDLEVGATYEIMSLNPRHTLNGDDTDPGVEDDPYYKRYKIMAKGENSFKITEENKNNIYYRNIGTVTPQGDFVAYDFGDQTYSEYIKNQTIGEHDWLLPTPENLVNIPETDIAAQALSPFRFNKIGDDFVINDEVYGPGVAPISVTPGTVQDWKLTNESDGEHTFHIHQTHFVVIKDTTEAQPSVLTYRDNIDLPKKSSITVRIPFNHNPTILKTGDEFVFHCHVLAHEDSGMMRRVVVGDPPV